MSKVFEIIAQLVELIADAIKNGATDEEIRERIARPNGVGQKLIDSMRSTTRKLDDFVKKG
jgi:hypothetical protein